MLFPEKVSITVTNSEGKKFNTVATIMTDGSTNMAGSAVTKKINTDWTEYCKAHGEISYVWNYK